jgi:hypothetical protein
LLTCRTKSNKRLCKAFPQQTSLDLQSRQDKQPIIREDL